MYLLKDSVIEWEEAYSIGDKKIDAEHKKLFDIASVLNKEGISKEEVALTIKELIKYTKFHFINEENFMREVSYSGLKAHKLLHKKIIDELNLIVKASKVESMELIINKLQVLVNKNILNHILLDDKKVHHSLKNREDLKKNFMWKMSYKLGNELLDEEHKKLFDIAIKALDYHNTDIKSHVRLTINELYSYMKTHFEHEEEYMLEINYSGYEEHKRIHEEIIEQMNKFIKLLPQLKIVEFEKKLIEYMDIWLINHILHEDKKLLRNYSKV